MRNTQLMAMLGSLSLDQLRVSFTQSNLVHQKTSSRELSNKTERQLNISVLSDKMFVYS